jgi:Esterase PHB depolymerase
LLLCILAVLIASLAGCSPSGETLPKLGIEIDKTSASGLSAGAYMAGQLQVAHSNSIIGAGIVAGGPYGCAETGTQGLKPPAIANATHALENCMSDKGGVPAVPGLVARAKGLASQREIDPLEGLPSDKVYLFSGGADRIVARSVVEAAKDFYVQTGIPEANIKLDTRDDAGHAFLTTDAGTACGLSTTPFMSDCDYDQAGAILGWVYGDLTSPSKELSGKFLRFDQSEFVEGYGSGLSKEGVVYVPQSCSEQTGCRLHIALHGCEQNLDQVGMEFVEGSGFARWADTNRFVVLFPQVSASLVNPKGCWDWWGYSGSDYLTKDGPQIAAIWRMVERLAMLPTRKQPPPGQGV